MCSEAFPGGGGRGTETIRGELTESSEVLNSMVADRTFIFGPQSIWIMQANQPTSQLIS